MPARSESRQPEPAARPREPRSRECISRLSITNRSHLACPSPPSPIAGSMSSRRKSTTSSSRHMLADGYDIVMDLRKSKGSWVFDSRRGPQRPRLLHQLRLGPHRLQPSQDGHPGVPRAHRRRGDQQAGQLRHLHDLHGRVRRDLRAPGRARRRSTSTSSSSKAAPSASRTPSRPRSTGKSTKTVVEIDLILQSIPGGR